MKHIEDEAAKSFLKTFSDEDKVWTFQAFSDTDDSDRALARTLQGSFEGHRDTLEMLSMRGAGIFVSMNGFDQGRRRAETLTEVRSFYADFDKGTIPLESILEESPIPPTMTVESSPGKFHLYWILDCAHGPSFKEEYTNVQNAIIYKFRKYGIDNLKDLARVLRLPGALHKKGKPFRSRIIQNSGPKYDWDTVAKAFPPSPNQDKHVRPEGMKKNAEGKYVKEVNDVDRFINSWMRKEATALVNAGKGKRHYTLTRVMTSLHYFIMNKDVRALAAKYLLDAWDKVKPEHHGEFYKLLDWCDSNITPDTILKEKYETVQLDSEPNLTVNVIPQEHPEYPFEICPDGLMGQIIDFTLRRSSREQPLLALAAALSFCSTIFSRRWAHWEFSTRTHMYIFGIALSGAGKETARSAISALAYDESINLPNLATKTDITSAAGLFEDMAINPVRLLCIDEAHELIQKIASAKSGNWEKAIKGFIMKCFSSDNTITTPDIKKKNPNVEELPLVYPALNLYCTTTETLYNYLKSSDVMDGFLNRFLVFESNVLPPMRRGARKEEPTVGLIKAIQKALEYGPSYYKTAAGKTIRDDGTEFLNSQRPMPASRCGIVLETPEAEALRTKYLEEIDNKLRVCKARGVWVRTAEYMTKLAMVLALSEMPPIKKHKGQDSITMEPRHIQWGYDIAIHCTKRLEVLALENISENPYDARFKYLLARIKENGVMKGVDWKVPRHNLDDRIIKQMLDDGSVLKVSSEKTSKGRGRPPGMYQYIGD